MSRTLIQAYKWKSMKLISLCACALAVMYGCGGGGSNVSNSTSPATTTFNADAAFATLFSTPTSFNGLTGRDSAGNNYALNLSFTPAPDFTFNGKAYRQSVQNVFLFKNGIAVKTEVTGEHFSTQFLYALNPTSLVAIIRAGRGCPIGGVGGNSVACTNPITYSATVYSTTSTLPIAGTVGSSGTLATGISYSSVLSAASNTGATITGSAPLAWSIEADTATTAFACIATPAEKDCLKINSAGVISGAKATIQIGTESLTFQ